MSAASPEVSSASAKRWAGVGPTASAAIAALPPGDPRERVVVQGQSGRKFAFLRLASGKVACADFHCYHHGGALGDGDLVEIEDSAALRCPMHGHLICLTTGRRLEHSSAAGCLVAGEQQQQRVYPVHVDADGAVRVQVGGEAAAPLPSDVYNYNPTVAPTSPGTHERSTGRLPFAVRRRTAIEAVKRRSLSNPPSPAAQRGLGGFFAAASSAPAAPEGAAPEGAAPYEMDVS